MKNIQVIDGALNRVYDIFQAGDDDVAQLFGKEADIAFAEDFEGRDDLLPVFERIWRGRIPKVQAQGIHGTCFVGLEHKKVYYPTRRDEEAVIRTARGFADVVVRRSSSSSPQRQVPAVARPRNQIFSQWVSYQRLKSAGSNRVG